MDNVMKAVRLHAFGGPEVLAYEDALKPVIGAGEVLVRVHAVGVNPPDWYLREGYKMLPPDWQPKMVFPIIPGTDISGVVEAVADDVTGFAVGDEVYAMVRFPNGLNGESRAYAQYVAVPASELALKPAGIDHIHAAAAPMSLLTAWQFIIEQGHEVRNPLQPHPHVPVPLDGKTVLINGAGGGVGHLLVQLAKWRGAQVIAVASGKHAALLRALGADAFYDYRQTKVEEVLRDLDLVVDAVGGPQSRRFLQTLKPGGSLFPIFGLGYDDGGEAARRGISVSTTQVNSNGAQLAQIAPLLDEGTIRVVIDSTFPLGEARRAHEHAAKGNLQGKIVLTVA
ncbi:NADPH:quinone reductase-like Zn-dependent oxidoreductase [Ancylobacter sp. 3268]|uniref:NADP-dependent oxidoreductase n=1 Tax=Ancylobacter sp. 3268 TaxID=2817752 RepID=UPI00286529EF|nr:NADP-dependent oxidoreductase [Ancylobacter sp. 3268]MDR6954628.1 NADPH:quinone reductase-like Zn-dependent oxidoreductase [Ancylobacter sp. 3268]